MSEWRTFTDREALDHSLAAHVVSKLALGIAARGTGLPCRIRRQHAGRSLFFTVRE
jgi:hypothetical protein